MPREGYSEEGYTEEEEDSDEEASDDHESEDEDETDGEDEEEDVIEAPVAARVVVEVSDSDTATTPFKNFAPEVEDDEEEEEEWNRENVDGLFCSICMEPWCNSGEHLPSCLSCGHMFGMSCIKKWLGQCRNAGKLGKCPQCNKRCSLKDIRRIYGSRVVVVDEESQKRIRFLEAKCNSLEKKDDEWRKKEVEWRTKLSVCQKKEALLRQKFEGLNERTSNLERSVEELGMNSRPIAAGQNSGKKMRLNHSPVSASSFELQQDLQLDGARLFDVDHVGQILVIARKPTRIAGPHVLTKMSLVSPSEQDDVLLPTTVKLVKDVRVSSSGRLALLASMGKKLTVVSLDSNNIVVNYDLPVAAWSCSWDINNSNHVYAGLQNGMVLVFDLRQTERPLESMTGLTSSPVHTIYSLSENSAGTSGTKNLLTASSVGLCQWSISGVQERPILIDEPLNRGVCISLAYCRSTDDVVATFRPKVETSDDNSISQVSQTQLHNMGQNVSQTQLHNMGQNVSQTQPHNLGQNVIGSHSLFKRRNSCYHSFGSISALVPRIRLPKSTILGIGDDTSVFACGHDSTSNLALLELPSFTVTHCLQLNRPVLDVKYATSSKPNLLCCLSEDRVQLFSPKLS